MIKIKNLVVLVVLLAPIGANASLIEGLCDGTADVTVTCDTETGLEWLDLTETVGLPPSLFVANVHGWVTAGWNMATSAQVDALLAAAGFTIFDSGAATSEATAAQLMVDLFGTTTSVVIFGQGFAVESATAVSFPYYFVNSGSGAAGSSANCCTGYNTAGPSIGIWANRAGAVPAVPVPAPGTLALVSLALAGWGLTRRKDRLS